MRGRRRRDRRRQEHAAQPDSAVLRCHRRPRARRRRRRPRTAISIRCDGASGLCFKKAFCSATPSRPTSPSAIPTRRASRSSGRPRSPRPTNSFANLPNGYDTVIGEYGCQPVGRAAATAGDRPGDSAGAADPDSRRRHGVDRSRHGARNSRGDGERHARANDVRHRPSPQHAAPGRYGCRARRGPNRRTRHARTAYATARATI